MIIAVRVSPDRFRSPHATRKLPNALNRMSHATEVSLALFYFSLLLFPSRLFLSTPVTIRRAPQERSDGHARQGA